MWIIPIALCDSLHCCDCVVHLVLIHGVLTGLPPADLRGVGIAELFRHLLLAELIELPELSEHVAVVHCCLPLPVNIHVHEGHTRQVPATLCAVTVFVRKRPFFASRTPLRADALAPFPPGDSYQLAEPAAGVWHCSLTHVHTPDTEK
jgi:hypothetical protein